jgi:hypothetical protein
VSEFGDQFLWQLNVGYNKEDAKRLLNTSLFKKIIDTKFHLVQLTNHLISYFNEQKEEVVKSEDKLLKTDVIL